MHRCTEYQNITLSTGGCVIGENLIYLQMLFDQLKEFDRKLQKKREIAYLNKESVYDISVNSVKKEFHSEILIPEKTIEQINETAIHEWEHMYESIIYNKNHASFFSNMKQKDRRLYWDEALEKYSGTNRHPYNTLSWSTDNVSSGMEDDEYYIDLELNNGNLLRVFTEQKLFGSVDNFTTVDLIYNNEQEIKTIEGVSELDKINELEIIFYNDFPKPRQYTNRDDISSEIEKEHTEILNEFTDPYINSHEMSYIIDVILDGYFTHQEKLEWVLLLCGQKKVIRLNYGYSVPNITDSIIRAFNFESTHIPQTGDVLISKNEDVHKYEYLSEEFPEKQRLNFKEEIQIQNDFSYEEENIVYNILYEKELEYIQQKTLMYEYDLLNDEDIKNLLFITYTPKPEEDNIFDAVKKGKENKNKIKLFDEVHQTDILDHFNTKLKKRGYF